MYRLMRFFRGYDRSRHDRILQVSIFFLVWSVAFAVFEYFVPLYLQSLEISFLLIGIISSGTSFISLFLDPLLGHIQKRFPPKTLLLASIFLFIANIMLLVYSGNIILLLFLATSLYGIAFDLFEITTYKSIFDDSVESDRSQNLSFLESSNGLGILIGASIAGFLFSRGTTGPVMFAIVLLVFLSVLISFRLKNRMSGKHQAGKQLTGNRPIEALKKSYSEFFYELRNLGRTGILLLLLFIFINLWDGFFFVFEPIFATKFQGHFISENILGGFLLATYILPILLFEIPMGRLEDRLGRKKFIILGLVLSASAIFLLQSSDNIMLTFFSVFMVSTGFFAIASPAIGGFYESITEKRFGKANSGNSVSMIQITLSIGFFLGPIIGGLFLSFEDGFNSAFRIFAVATLVVALLAALLLKKKA